MSIQFNKVQGVSIIFLMVLFLLSGVLPALAVDIPIKTPYKGVTLTLAMETGPQYEFLAKNVPEFEKRTGIKVKVDLIPVMEIKTKYTTEFMAETGAYDIVEIGYTHNAYFVENKWYEPLGKYFEQGLADPSYDFDDFASTAGMYYKDILVGLPYMASTNVFYYRKDLFRNAGFEGPPETFSEEIECARKLTNPPNYGVVIQGEIKKGFGIYVSMIWSCGGKIFDENWNPVFDQEPGVKGLTFYCDLVKYAPPDLLVYGWLEVLSAFVQGNAAMCHLYPEGIPDFTNPERSRIIGKWDLAVVPHGKGYPSIQEGCTEGLHLASQSKHKKAAFKLMEFLTSKEVALKMALADEITSPCRTSVLTNPKFVKKAWWAPKLSDILKHGRVLPVYPGSEEVEYQFLEAWQDAVVGKKSPREALSDAADEARKILKRVGLLK